MNLLVFRFFSSSFFLKREEPTRKEKKNFHLITSPHVFEFFRRNKSRIFLLSVDTVFELNWRRRKKKSELSFSFFMNSQLFGCLDQCSAIWIHQVQTCACNNLPNHHRLTHLNRISTTRLYFVANISRKDKISFKVPRSLQLHAAGMGRARTRLDREFSISIPGLQLSHWLSHSSVGSWIELIGVKLEKFSTLPPSHLSSLARSSLARYESKLDIWLDFFFSSFAMIWIEPVPDDESVRWWDFEEGETRTLRLFLPSRATELNLQISISSSSRARNKLSELSHVKRLTNDTNYMFSQQKPFFFLFSDRESDGEKKKLKHTI